MAVLDSDVLSQSLKAPLECPADVLKMINLNKSVNMENIPVNLSGVNSLALLSTCFDKIFLMMASENCCISVEKILQLWISINLDITGTENCATAVPPVALAGDSITALIKALTKNTGIGVQEWGLGFQCLTLVTNQRNISDGCWLHIMRDKLFSDMILKFISGTGMNFQKSNVVSVGPTVCQHFFNFLLRLREHCGDSTWTPCLKEILLRVLSVFLSGPFLNSDFPLDAFNKFLDRVMCPDLSYENSSTVVSIVEYFAQALHLYVFCPNKISVRSNAELKGAPPTTTATGIPLNGDTMKPAKPETFETTMFRLLTLARSIVSLPYKTRSLLGEQEQQLLLVTSVSEKLRNYEHILLEYVRKCGEPGPRTIADVISQMEPTVMRILSALANPNGINVLVGGDLPTAFNIIETSSPTTLVDSVIQLFTKICNCVSQPKWIIQPMFKFLSKTPYDDFYCPLIVSETFVLMVLKLINKEENLEEFANLNCVKSVCDKLVASSRKFFSSCPTFVSILTQYIGRTDSNAMFGQKKFGNEVMDVHEGLINVAPLGSISASNFSAHPSEILLQASPPHRRARTPVWSYHFFPEETSLELIITLPCAILLKEVQIVPHISTLTTSCPSAIMIEISRDRSNLTVPMGPPAQCSGMTTININLSKPEVAQTVLLRLFKPQDSSNLGLSQIRLLGFTTFSEAAFQGLSQSESVKNLESSAQWMYILDRAITVSANNPELKKRIVDIAVNIPDILESCYSILMSPVTVGKAHEVYLPHAASVLFNFGSSKKEISEQLLNSLLGPVQLGFSHGMVANASAQSTMGLSQLNTVVDLIYKLCCNIPGWGFDNLANLISWLHSCADKALQGNADAKNPVPEYVQAVSSALWTYAAQRKMDLSTLATPEFLMKLLSWSKILDTKSGLKAAVDHMICSVCYCKPWLFVYLMVTLGVVKQMDWTVVDKPLVELLPVWYEEGSTWDRVVVQDLDTLSRYLNPGTLMTLARAAQSPTASQMLYLSQFVGHLNTAIMDFWNYYTTIFLNGDGFMNNVLPNIISTPSIIAVLEFYGELCRVNQFKDWFGTNGSIFWLPLLNLLSTLPENLKANFYGSYVYDLESVVINFLSKCCWSHPENQKIIASCLCDIILKQKATPHKAVFLHSMSSFCRRLFIQLLLENEKLVVQIKSYASIPLKSPFGSLPLSERHPSMGGDSVFLMNTNSYIYDLLKLIDPFVSPLPLDKVSTKSEPTRIMAPLKHEDLHNFKAVQVGHILVDSVADNTSKPIKSFLETKRPTRIPARRLKPEESSDTKKEGIEADNRLPSLVLEAEEFPDVKIPLTLPLSVILAAIREQRPDCFLTTLVIVVRTESSSDPSPSPILSTSPQPHSLVRTSQKPASSDVFQQEPESIEVIPDVYKILPLPSTVEVFSHLGGLGILAKHLPVVYPETLRQIAVGSKFTGTSGIVMNDSFAMASDDWVKVENSDDFYDDMMDSMVASTPVTKRGMSAMRPTNLTPGVPPHSMAAFGIFLSLPRFPEVLLRERLGSQCMLRLVMGVSDDADGNDIFGSPVAKTLPTLPFHVLKCLLDMQALNSDEGRNLRRSMVDMKATHFILAILSIFTHQPCDPTLVPGLQHELVMAATKAQGGYIDKPGKSDDKAYWAKGTGFGTGSTSQSWDIELAMQKKKSEEENVTCLLQVLSSFIYPRANQEETSAKPSENEPEFSGSDLPDEIPDLLSQSCLFPAIAGYLRNDSVLDLGRHVPLYKSVLQFLRALVHNSELLILLAPWGNRGLKSTSNEDSISVLLSKLKDIVDSYARRLMSNSKKGSKVKNGAKTLEELEDEGLALLIPDIQSTAKLVENAITELTLKQGPVEMEIGEDCLQNLVPIQKTLEQRYLEEMKKLQFAFFEMITEEEESGGIRFTVSYHYAGNVRANFSRSFPARLKRLAQESVTLSTSLPIAYGSTIFVRCDTDRLDIMKVLITGPAGTPYANGCFEFDVYFPSDYPNAPMMINLETTGRQRIRFNPNLYTDGKVCLSILNTWHGRPEEKWNPQTSSLLPVLVAIQSLILNAEPYFNEPGYEKSRGTDTGECNSREYNAGIQIATVEWAMLDQIRRPSACFKEIIQHHFWLKRGEIIEQCEQWLQELIVTCRNDKRAGKSVTGNLDPVSVFKNNLALLKKEFGLMKPPPGLEDLVDVYPPKTDDGGGTSSTIPASIPSPETPKALNQVTDCPNTSDSLEMTPTNWKEDSDESMITDT